MIKTGVATRPYNAKYIGIMGTQFSVPQSHKGENGETVLDGFIQVVAPGEYKYERGDKIIVTNIKSVMLRKAKNGTPYYTVYADIELDKQTFREKKGKRDIAKLKEDIPEELL